MTDPTDSDLPPATGEVTELLFRALEGREEVDVEALCRARPEHADEIRRRFSAMQSALQAFERAGGGAPPAETAPAWEAFLEQLRARGEGASRYDDEGEIARGGMGVVRRVFDRDLRRPLAMKRILDVRAGDAMVGRFLEEAQVAGQLDHPGIVPVHDLGVDAEGRVFFTMKLVEGEHLGKVLAKVRAGADGWSMVRALGVLLRACEAVAFAHAKGVVHRDLKPENIMVGRFGETYVMDWGLARIVGRVAGARDVRPIETERGEVDADSPLRTMEGEAVGTPYFMAPEQAQGRLEAIGPATDVYAVGCILYQLLTGRSPYEDPGSRSTSREVIDALLKGPPPRARALASAAPPELEAICEKAMERDISRRYGTMVEFAEDLRAYQENRVVRAHATGPWAELVKWVARNRAMAWTAAAAALLVVVLTAGFFARLDRERRAAEESADVAREINAFLTEDLLAAVQPSAEAGRGRDVTMRVVLDEASRRIEGRFEGRPAVEAALRRTLGESYRQLGEPEASEPHLRRGVDVAAAHHGDAALETLGMRNVLGMTLHDLGRYEESARLMRELVATAAAALGDEDEVVLTFRSNLTGVLRKLGEVDEAYEIDREVLELRLRRGDGDESSVLNNLNGIALLYYEMGRYDEAEGLLEQAYGDANEWLGARDPVTLTYAQNLATLYVAMGRAERAEELLLAALEGMTEVLGPRHAQTLNVSRNYAGLLRRQKRFDEGEARYREVIALMREAYGGEHVQTLGCVRDYAVLLLDAGRLEEALPLLEEALAGQRRLLGDDHETTTSTMSSLAVLLFQRGRIEEAGALFVEILARRRARLGDDHPSTLTSMENLLVLHRRRGALDEAEALGVELVERTAADDPKRPIRESLLEKVRADRSGGEN